MTEEKSLIIAAYRRILAAAKSGRGVRLSREEVWSIATMDSAIQGAVEADELQREEVSGG